MRRINPLLLADFYKTGHIYQYPEGTEMVYSNWTPRGSRIKGINEVVVFGLQYFIKEYLINQFNEGFFNQPKDEVVSEYKRIIDNSIGPDAVKMDHIESLHDLGYLPLEIKAMDEGSKCPMRIPCVTIKNTIPEFFWVTNYIESLMSAVIWMPMTSATTADKYREMLDEYAVKTSDIPEFVDWQAHDFSFRGMSGLEAACISGAGHLTSFNGTDTIPAISFLEEYYNAESGTDLFGSLPASEHSCMSLSGNENEFETFKRFITEIYPAGMVSIVSDTWDLWKVLTDYLPRLKDEIMARDGKVIIRPDSGDPVDILCGTMYGIEDYTNDCSDFNELKAWIEDAILEEVREETPHGEMGPSEHTIRIKYQDKYYDCSINNISWNRHDKQYYFIDMWEDANLIIREVDLTPQDLGVIELLWNEFGGEINSKGFKQLDSHIGVIYGDAITLERCKEICKRSMDKGFASTIAAEGIGSFNYTYVTRDTFGFAMKATAGIVNGKLKNIWKDPVTDNGVKKSAKGLLMVDENFNLHEEVSPEIEETGILKTVFKNGKLLIDHDFKDIRNRIKNNRMNRE